MPAFDEVLPRDLAREVGAGDERLGLAAEVVMPGAAAVEARSCRRAARRASSAG